MSIESLAEKRDRDDLAARAAYVCLVFVRVAIDAIELVGDRAGLGRGGHGRL